MRGFVHVYIRLNIIKDKKCFKNPHSSSCIDLIITNRPEKLQICLPDFHKISLTVLKIFYRKQCPNIVGYRNYHNFDNELFLNDVGKRISQEYCQNQF